MFENIIEGTVLVLTWEALLWIIIGYSLGSLLGAIPGLTGIVGIALLLPLSFYLPPWVAIPMLIAVGKGSSFGSSIPAILINTPGTPAAAATCIDGYELTKQGKSGKALKASLYAGLIGDVFSDLVLIFAAVALARVALSFGPAEYTSLMFFALTVVGAVAATAVLKGIMGATLGIFLSMIGTDMITGVPRMTFGILELSDGISMIPLMIGLLAMSEIILQAEKIIYEKRFNAGPRTAEIRLSSSSDHSLAREDLPGFFRGTVIGSIIGTGIGILPGLGQSVAAFVGYGEAKRFSRHPEKFGKGAVEGVAAPEAAGNAVNGANMVPLLALGIPGDVIAAILLGALMVHGLTPGPLLFEQHGVTIVAIYAGMMITNFVHWPIGLLFIRISRLITLIKFEHLMPFVLVFCIGGTYAINNSLFDVYVLVITGVVGAVLRKRGFAPVTIVIGFILGPLLENSFRQTLLISQGNYLVFFERPVSLGIILVALGSVTFTFFMERRRRTNSRIS